MELFFDLFTRLLCEKIYLHESSLFVEYNEVSLKIVLQTFIKMNYQILKSYKLCYEAKLISLDWARYATPFKPGRKFSTYLAQSKLHPGEFIKYLHQLLLKP